MKEDRGDFSHLKNKKGEFTSKPLPQPTLPNLSVDDDVDDKSSMHTRVAPSTYTQDSYYYYNSDVKAANPPPMPAYNPYSTHQPPDAYATFNPSQATFQQQDEYPSYEDESSMHLTSGAAPFSHSQYPIDRTGSAASNPYHNGPGGYPNHPDRTASAASNPYQSGPGGYDNYEQPNAPPFSHSQYPIERTGSAASNPYNGTGSYDAHDVYQGRAVPSPRPQQRAPPSGLARPVSGLAYDDADAYGGYTASPLPQQQQHQPQPGMWNPGRDVERGGY